ncbi:MAG TPA: class IIb bacteriocin, lactobin A/cerein 7B family [Vicinamibacterales bacterium]|jgi:predicted ribosomally synthesized peptide with nif11-like leader
MSVQDLKRYGTMAVQDPKVGRRAKEIGLANVKGQAAYAKTLGFQFDERDMEALAKEMTPSGELSESELSSVAGGFATSVAAAVVGAAVGVGAAATAVTSTTSSGGW